MKRWLRASVVERRGEARFQTGVAADTNRGTPQGSPISPLLSNLYFRRFVLAWKQFGHGRTLSARVVNYADDLVICCRPGFGARAMTVFRNLIARPGLRVNERKTRLVLVPEESFDFLGYTVGRFYGKQGLSYMGTRPSKKSVQGLLERVHEETSSHWNWQEPAERVAVLNRLLRGWCGYFNRGPVTPVYRVVRQDIERRVRKWLMRRGRRRGTGYKRFPDRYLYGELGLFLVPLSRKAMPNAKS